ncbi:MAG: two-component sensor histidine kinase [Crocinitomicaceae bacterium]|jgi:signal transduction histidine kinase|nr:two-component sensor histidine kinase [Crocinitomicaceae bacterium]|tara:strand:+ start:46434 stop:47894 length:1461 start_codon:yes stop_codon:yes gene_type:complete
MKMILDRLSLRNRIYISLTLLVVISFIIIGAVTIWYTHIENERYHNQRLERKEKAITAALSYFLEDKEEDIYALYTRSFHEKIVELADIHGLEVNLYDMEGKWIASSNFDYFDQGILPEILDDQLMQTIFDNRGHYVSDRYVGDEDLLTAFTFLRGAYEEPIALVSIPYFTSNEIQKEETFELLYRLGQIYLLLMLGALAIAFFLSNYITKSLQSITQKIRSLSLTEANEEIQWESNDEIGELIDEYNKKVRELKSSADLLAKSEREGAWREMARQVAHEIKNPLTPMKLSVQQLERSWKDGKEDFSIRMKRFNETMTQQIDTLSDIATEFSNFAKLNKSKPEKINLTEDLKNCIKLFDGESINIQFSSSERKTEILIDKTHFNRIFTNLITNAIEAIGEGVEGQLKITVVVNENDIDVLLADNGIGIEPEKLGRIFEPNFTTKSTGTGLGLAMVKGMLDAAKASISVTSSAGEGSTFSLSFPKVT